MAAPIIREPEDRNLTEENRLAALLSSIVGDIQRLLRQEIALAKTEFSEDLRRAKTAAMLSSAGAFSLGIAGILFGFMVAQVLAEITDLPLWACSGIAAALFAAVGVTVLLKAKNSAKEIELIPQKTVENVKENVQWIKNRT